jgi:hypothetical protein
VNLRRRGEPLHERLAREAGLLPPGSGGDVRAPWDKAGIHGLHRPREWDEVVTAEADLEGDFASFVVLDKEIVIEEGPDDVEPLTEGVTTAPPYGAEARRVGPRLWTVGVRRIEVVTLPGREGQTLELISRDGFDELTVDDERVFGSIVSELAREGDYVVRGRRLDGELWEIETAPL